MNPKGLASKVLPTRLIAQLDRVAFGLRRLKIRFVHRIFGGLGYTVARKADYYSVLPALADIEASRSRWERPSELPGVTVDVSAMKERLAQLAARWGTEYRETTGSYAANQRRGFGPGYPELDAKILYYMLREHTPSTYLEVGCGLSTYYARFAAQRNAATGRPMKITCIEPYPFDALRALDELDLVEHLVQDVPISRFAALDAGDVLFIDSSHALKVDSDVAYLLLEVLPRLKQGVLVHIHDVPFPYNVPFPADTWLFGERWPVYWNEAMVVQAFLAFNRRYEVVMSIPLVRYQDAAFVGQHMTGEMTLTDHGNPASSLWLRRSY